MEAQKELAEAMSSIRMITSGVRFFPRQEPNYNSNPKK
jgi:hypothetical protein